MFVLRAKKVLNPSDVKNILFHEYFNLILLTNGYAFEEMEIKYGVSSYLWILLPLLEPRKIVQDHSGGFNPLLFSTHSIRTGTLKRYVILDSVLLGFIIFLKFCLWKLHKDRKTKIFLYSFFSGCLCHKPAAVAIEAAAVYDV